jgi:hypothetical protein
MKKILCLFFLLLLSLIAGAQSNPKKQWHFRLSYCTGAFGYIYQNENLFQFGPKFELINQRKNFSLIPLVQLSTRHVTYLNPAVLLRYYAPLGKNTGFALGIEGSYRQVLGQKYSVISPEAAIVTHDGMNFVVGYNFALDQLPSWAWKWRIGIRLMLF